MLYVLRIFQARVFASFSIRIRCKLTHTNVKIFLRNEWLILIALSQLTAPNHAQ